MLRSHAQHGRLWSWPRMSIACIDGCQSNPPNLDKQIMKALRRIAAALLLIATMAVAVAQTPSTIRVGVATGGVGTPPRTGSSSIGIVNAQGLLEKEFEKD